MMSASALVSALLLSACATGGPVPSDGCAWTRPILVGRDDVLTEDTAAQVLAHNETGARICGWRGG
jgi:hypothetical protein